MTIETFEFSLMNEIPISNLYKFLSEEKNIPIGKIVDENAFWQLSEDIRNTSLGVSIQISESGYRTTACIYYKTPFLDIEFDEFARKAALTFNTNVAIGDYRIKDISGQDRFLIYFPNGQIAEAVDDSDNQENNVKILTFLKTKPF